MMKISVLIPIKDEPYINYLVEDIHKALKKIKHEVIVIDKSDIQPKIKNAKLVLQKSNGLGKAGTPPDYLDVTATATFVPGQGITGMHLVLSGAVPGLTDDEFRAAAENAKQNCPVSQALAGNVPITLEVR